MNWSAVEAVSTFVTAVVALSPWPRPWDQSAHPGRPAVRSGPDVLVHVFEIWEPVGGDTARQFKGAKVVVYNHSDRPIALEGPDYIRHHQPEHPDLGPIQITALDIENRLVQGGLSVRWERYQEGGFAVVEFRDHDGQLWQRRSDVQDLRKGSVPASLVAAGFRGSVRFGP